MADLISRAALLGRFKALQEYDPEHEGRGWACNFLNDSREPSTEWYCVEDVVEDMPAVDAAPVVRARWHELKDGTEECTNCLGLCPHEENYNGDVIFNFGCEYCPWCGAKMDGERRESE